LILTAQRLKYPKPNCNRLRYHQHSK